MQICNREDALTSLWPREQHFPYPTFLFFLAVLIYLAEAADQKTSSFWLWQIFNIMWQSMWKDQPRKMCTLTAMHWEISSRSHSVLISVMNEVNQNNLMQQSESHFPPVLIFYDQKDSAEVRHAQAWKWHKKVCLLAKSSRRLTHADIYTHTQKHTLTFFLHCIA